jgi:hypothetical protein
METVGEGSVRRPLMMRAARECQSSDLGYHYDQARNITVIDGGSAPVVSVAIQLLKTSGVQEDIC